MTLNVESAKVKTGNIVQSCDLCRLKKRKCDLKEGIRRCSTCTKLKAPCRRTHVAKPRQKKKKQMETLEDRLKSLEELIRGSIVRAAGGDAKVDDAAEAPTPISLSSPLLPLDPFALAASSMLQSSASELLDPALLLEKPDPTLTSLETSRSPQEPAALHAGLSQPDPEDSEIDLQPTVTVFGDKRCSLPPREGGIFLLQEFLVDFNIAVPLFDPVALGGLFEDCYKGRPDAQVLSWNVLKLVIAIAHRLRAMSPLGVPQDTENAEIYLKECLGDLGLIIVGAPSLLLCQYYVAMAVVISMSSHPKPAATFASLALRVAQDLGIHEALQDKSISSRDRLQRRRVFWIAYCIDADWSLRKGKLPTLSPSLVKIEIPAETDSDSAGELRASGGEFSINVFRRRVELALIQADLMERLHMPESARPPNYNVDIMWQAVALKLLDWRQSWLCELSVEQLQSTLHRSDLVHAIAVEAASFKTIYSFVVQFQEGEGARSQPFSPDGLMRQSSRSQSHLSYRNACRFLSLLRSVPGDDVAVNWLAWEATVAAMAVLLSYIIRHPEESNARANIHLAQAVLHTLNQLCNISEDDELADVQNVCVDLYLRAERAMQEQEQQQK